MKKTKVFTNGSNTGVVVRGGGGGGGWLLQSTSEFL